MSSEVSSSSPSNNDGPPLLSRTISLNENWLTQFSRKLSVSQTDLSVEDEPSWFDDVQSVASVTSSMADDPLPINRTLQRRGSLDLQQMRKDAAAEAKTKRTWTHNRVANWLLNSGKASDHHTITRISESSEFIGPEQQSQTSVIPDNVVNPVIAKGSLTDAVNTAGLSSGVSKGLSDGPGAGYHGKRRLSLRELNAVTPSGF